MNKSKRSCSDDRLSKLPDSLIFNIFWFLPIRDVVRTTKLSRRWRDLWKTCPFLNFSGYRVEDDLDKVGNIFNRALILWRGAELLKFKIRIRHELSASFAGDVNVWFHFAKEKEVKELFLDLPCSCEGDGNDIEILYSCSSLEVLSINCCPLSNGGNGNVRWDRLKSLTIKTWHLGEDFLSKVLCGSPKLEVFSLDYMDRGGNWCIQSTSLKKLSIMKWSEIGTYVSNSEIEIQAPNLETLEIKGAPYSEFLMDAAPLTDVTLGLNCLDRCCDDEGTLEIHDIRGTLEQILSTIPDVETLTLRQCCIEVLGTMNMQSLLSPLSKVKFLKLSTSSSHSGSFTAHLKIALLLRNFPKMERLVIDDIYENDLYEDENEDAYQDDEETYKFEVNLPNSFLL